MSLPYFPMFPTDFDADTGHLTFAEDGAYNRLLRLSWKCPSAKMPDDMDWIHRRARAVSIEEKAIIASVIAEFFTRSGGKIFSARLAKEWQKSSLAHSKRVSAGSAGGKAKALKANKSEPSNAVAKPYQPEPEPEPYKKEEDTNVSSVVSLPDRSSECIAHFNAIARRVGWPEVQKFTPPRRATLSQRIADVGGVDAWMDAITRASSSPLLTGQNNRAWRADFDWLSKAANFTKLMEGNYDPRTSNANPAQVSKHRADPALEQIARLAGLVPTPGYGGR